MPTPLRSWFRIEQARASEADVYIFDEIGVWGVTASDFVAELNAISAPTINLHLNTPGGDVFDGIAIYNALVDHPAVVNAYIPGIAASIGTVIAMGADRRVIAPHARMMIHDAWVLVAGDAADLRKLADRLDESSANIAAIYAEHAGGTADEWRDRMRAESWYTDQQAVDVGLAHEVGRSNDDVREAARQAAKFDFSKFRYRDAERQVAMLRDEVGDVEPPETADPVLEHACACGGADDCPLVVRAQAPAEPESINDEIVREREELEAALASVRPQEVYRWL